MAEALGLTGGKETRLQKQPGARSCKIMSLATQSMVLGSAASASPETLFKLPQYSFPFFYGHRTIKFQVANTCLQKNHFSNSLLQIVVAMWHKGSDIYDFSEVSLKVHPFLLPPVWNTNLKPPSLAATLSQEISLSMEATQGKTIRQRSVSLTLWMTTPALSNLPVWEK